MRDFCTEWSKFFRTQVHLVQSVESEAVFMALIMCAALTSFGL